MEQPQKLVALLAPEQVAQFWPGIHARMMERPRAWEEPPELTLAETMRGNRQMWALVNELSALDAVLISRIEMQPKGKTLVVIGAWGDDFDDYIDPLAAAMDRVAERLGVEFFQIEGRPGWMRKLRRLGFVAERVVMVKEARRTLH